jgi:hypothetical protein
MTSVTFGDEHQSYTPQLADTRRPGEADRKKDETSFAEKEISQLGFVGADATGWARAPLRLSSIASESYFRLLGISDNSSGRMEVMKYTLGACVRRLKLSCIMLYLHQSRGNGSLNERYLVALRACSTYSLCVFVGYRMIWGK